MGLKENIESILSLQRKIIDVYKTSEQETPKQEPSGQETLEQETYHRIPNHKIEILLKDFESCIHDFLNFSLGYKEVQYTICGLSLIDAIIRVDTQVRNFTFHHNMILGDVGVAALYVYWIVKLRPINITDPRYINIDGYNNQVNELFAIHYLLSALVGAGKIELWDGHKGVNLSINHPFIKKLCHQLRYSELTADAMLVFANAIETGIFKT
jgi:hypothetical protein